MATKGNSAFAPANGSSRDDVAEPACDMVFGAEPNLLARNTYRNKPFGGRPGDCVEPIEGGWQKQGHYVQPLPDGFSLPALSNALLRRDEFELDGGDNFDPIQAQPPRLKKLKDSE